MLVNDNSRKYPTPESGEFLGTIADVVDLGIVHSPKWGDKAKIRIVWVLDKLDAEGKPFRIQRTVNATVSSGPPKPSDLYNIVKDVTGQAPAVPFETEVLIGRSNKLFIIKEGEYANIKGILPVPAGVVPPPIPAGFVRAKDKDQQPVQAQAPATVQQPVQAVATATVPQAQIPPTMAQAAPQPTVQAGEVVQF